MTQATVQAVSIGAAHDGAAELILTLRYANGGVTNVTLDAVATDALYQSCAAESPEDLIGTPWQRVRDALGVSWNRYNAPV